MQGSPNNTHMNCHWHIDTYLVRQWTV